MGERLSSAGATWRLCAAIVLLVTTAVGAWVLAVDAGAGYANLEANSSAPYRALGTLLYVVAGIAGLVGVMMALRSLREPGSRRGAVLTAVLLVLAVGALSLAGVALAHGFNVSV
jgi:hypothetical protein